jgi:hypothetical protein
MDLRVTPNGTARPEEVLAQLGLRDLLDAGFVLERTRLALEEEGTSPLSPSGERGEEPLTDHERLTTNKGPV